EHLSQLAFTEAFEQAERLQQQFVDSALQQEIQLVGGQPTPVHCLLGQVPWLRCRGERGALDFFKLGRGQQADEILNKGGGVAAHCGLPERGTKRSGQAISSTGRSAWCKSSLQNR